MNEKNIQQVLEIEKQAQEIYEKAKRDAQEMPITADQEAQAIISKAKDTVIPNAQLSFEAIK